MNWLKFKWVFLLVTINVVIIMAVPANISKTREKDQKSGTKYVEIKLPVKITSMEDLVAWVKNAMQTMASRIDITLAADSSAQVAQVPDQKNAESKPQVSENKMVVLKPEEVVEIPEKNVQPKLPIIRSLPGFENPWFPYGNDVFPPIINADAYLPLFVGDLGNRYALPNPGFDVRKNYLQNIRQEITTTTTTTTTAAPKVARIENRSSTTDSSNRSGTGNSEAVPFAIPFEAFITITRDEETVTKEPVTMRTDLPDKQQEEFNGKKEVEVSTTIKSDGKKKDSARKRQIAVLGDLLEALGLTRRPDNKHRIEGSATTTVGTKSKRPREEPLRPPIAFGEVPPRPSNDDTFQRQEFENELDDDDEEEEEGGSLGSVADLIPIALPILEDLSDPESDADLIELLQAGVPILAGLSEPDEDGNGGAKELIDIIVPVITKIVNGPDGQGIDLGALIGPIFGLLAPFIGPVLAPVIGPLVRAISNPPTEGSSLGALLAAITGPLSTPQEPSGMSPLAIVIAGTAAALIRELKPGQPGGLDVGALVGAILTGVISGTSAGLSGGSSDSNNQPQAPYGHGVNQYGVAALINDNVIFPGRPSPGPPLNSPFIIKRPNNQAATVNIGSTIRPQIPPNSQHQYQQPPQNYQQPGPNYPQYQQSASNHPQYQQHRPQYHQPAPSRPVVQTQPFRPGPTPPNPYPYNQHTGLVPAAANNHPYGSNAVPASSVNPLALIGNTVKELLGGGISLVSSVINAVFGIVGASSGSSDSPAPSYGPPTGGHYTQASG